MEYLQLFFTSLVIIVHVYIVILEMFLWNKSKGIKAFGLKSKEFAEETKVLAANQGLYNGFLVIGLLWSLISNKNEVTLFFLTCVLVAGIYGAYSTKKIKIFYIQSIPALLGIICYLF